MALNKIKTNSLTDQSVEKAKIKNDAIDATKIADDAISEEHLDPTSIIGNTELAEGANASDILLIYDASAGALKKILASNVGTQVVTLTSISPTNATTGDGTGNHTFTITGTNLTGASAELVNTTGTIVNFDSVTVNSSTQITGVIAKSTLVDSGEPYDIRVIGSNGAQATLRNQINVNAQPVYTTASGQLGTVLVGQAGSFSVNATDPESAGNVTFELQSGSLPPGYTITNTAAEGGTAIIGGTDNSTSSSTLFNFVLRAVDAASNTSSRAFSIRSRVIVSQSFTSSGTFSVPSGTTSLDALVVAGGGGGGAPAPAPDALRAGGGGAGGLVYFPSYPVTEGGTITVTVGNGGPRANANTGNQGSNGGDSAFGSPGDPGLGQGGVLTAKGGGGGGASRNSAADAGVAGGSGGGGSISSQNGSTGAGASATQPTQPGNSGSYGFGNAGGNGSIGGGGGGGGAGAAGKNSNPGPSDGGSGGDGKAYTIADGTTSVYYAGGGGGAQNRCNPSTTVFAGGQGGGGAGDRNCQPRQSGTANKGGGGGGASEFGVGGDGGKGIVIVRY
tara:strand:- start:2024 stop:3709 length:1686 start_codon:yes stop_codon:yes gene_type:complete